MSQIKMHLSEYHAKLIWNILKDCLTEDKEGMDNGQGGIFYQQDRMAVMEIISVLAKAIDNQASN